MVAVAKVFLEVRLHASAGGSAETERAERARGERGESAGRGGGEGGGEGGGSNAGRDDGGGAEARHDYHSGCATAERGVVQQQRSALGRSLAILREVAVPRGLAPRLVSPLRFASRSVPASAAASMAAFSNLLFLHLYQVISYEFQSFVSKVSKVINLCPINSCICEIGFID